ncbi:hypothetical protein ABIE30_000669 [Janthinobacterium lividum]|uniref:hypothetical protein n=1 Tax=Janthinobacterium lividum TaxID=29581 RepID=UPI003D20A11C
MKVYLIRLAKFLFVASAFSLAGYFLIYLIKSNQFNLTSSIEWMSNNEKMSGWAQFFGSIGAIILAITIPAWQRHGQNLDRLRATTELNAALSQHNYFLLGEVRDHLVGYITRKRMARGIARNDAQRDDLLRRIHALENRENNADRITHLFIARGVIHQTNTAMSLSSLQNEILGLAELVMITERIDKIETTIKEAFELNKKAIGARNRANLWLIGRLLAPIIIYIAK